MNTTTIPASGGCRYLGVWWDSGLTFSEHFKRVRRRVDVLSYQLSMIAGRFFTRRAKLFFRIYKGALELFMLYGYGAWGHRLSLKKVRDMLNSVQRRPLVKITRAYRTTSTAALQVVSGVLPLDLKAQQVYAKFRLFTLKKRTARLAHCSFGAKIIKVGKTDMTIILYGGPQSRFHEQSLKGLTSKCFPMVQRCRDRWAPQRYYFIMVGKSSIRFVACPTTLRSLQLK
ncbi:hypothetical protein AVEN_82684-1 [Araneus ventricosus]|uniref:Uncharacterized protein n=1 Tax=Araneus ventricosus TaxID=182803 RepID=A0A4Y2WXA4_ARAVE|nr:hypothetical protein AVEN_245141-1 [Araneus ventricosus]GBO41489.1 hypothetical protein AVEN_82684-1 [Araneus ventricosus]